MPAEAGGAWQVRWLRRVAAASAAAAPTVPRRPVPCSRLSLSQVLREHGKQLHSVLLAWGNQADGACARSEFRRAAQALGALGLASRIPSDIELDSMFEVMAVGKDEVELAALLKQPLEPRTFEVVVIEEEDEFDPDDCFECFGERCMACNAVPAEGKKLLACQRCKRVRYCGRPCQLAGWRRGHKESCGKCLPRPSRVATGGPQYVLAALREYHAAHSGLSFACLTRLGAMALDPEQHTKYLRAMIDYPGGVEAVVLAMKAYAGARELILPGYMLLCAFCATDKEGAAAVVRAGGIPPLIELFKVSVNDAHLLVSGLTAMKQMATTGPTAKQALVDGQGVFGIVWAMREHQEDVPLCVEG